MMSTNAGTTVAVQWTGATYRLTECTGRQFPIDSSGWPLDACRRCSGVGMLDWQTHVLGGQCFACAGAGYYRAEVAKGE